MSKFIAYFRVSTQKQGISGLGLEAQEQAVNEYTAAHGELVAKFVEVESGSRKNRPQLDAALAECKKQKATLVVAKLDRLARNVAFVSSLMESKIDFVACDMPHANRFTIHILSAVAEYEREMISKRTKEALKAYRARGGKCGSHHPAVKHVPAIHKAAAMDYARKLAPIVARIRAEGHRTISAISEELNRRGVSTPSGDGVWHISTTHKYLQRIKALA